MHSERPRLTAAQVEAARALHSSLTQWQSIDKALVELQESLPGFGLTETLLKVAAVNALYGTNVLALMRAAIHVQKILGSVDLTKAGPALVESLADIPTTANARPRRYVSFASKFAHFFCSRERFPIYDSYALSMVAYHLGSATAKNPARPYEAFTRNLQRLKRQSGLECSYSELDRYLWIRGLYSAYEKGARRLNAELLQLFEKPTGRQRVLLQVLRGK